MRRVQLTSGVAAAATLALASASALAGFSVARNSVGSPQVIDNSLTSADVKDAGLKQRDLAKGSVTSKQIADQSVTARDLAPGAVPEVHTFIGDVASDGVSHDVLAVPGLATFSATCTATNVFIGYATTTTQMQYHALTGADVFDDVPAGAITTHGTGGGGGFGGPNVTVLSGDYFGRTSGLLAHGAFTVSAPGSTSCNVRVQVVVERLTTPVPVPRPVRAADSCVTDGSGYCLEP